MLFRKGFAGQKDAIRTLFADTFTASEGAAEGALIGDLVRDLMATTPADDLRLWSVHEGDALLGAVIFSRLLYPEDARTVFILSPVAVKTAHQGKGIGHALITHGLDDLRGAGVDYATTYGDPAYYVRVGFHPIDEDFAKAPLTLSMPQGWLGQPLSGGAGQPLIGPSRCVPALNRPELW
ncbi:MAG: N-acetyltransferase [Pseudomonadota bacterium]